MVKENVSYDTSKNELKTQQTYPNLRAAPEAATTILEVSEAILVINQSMKCKKNTPLQVNCDLI